MDLVAIFVYFKELQGLVYLGTLIKVDKLE